MVVLERLENCDVIVLVEVLFCHVQGGLPIIPNRSPHVQTQLREMRFSHWSNFARLAPKELPVVIDTNSQLIHKYNRLEAIPAMFATPREPSSLVCVSVMKGFTDA